MLSFSKGRKIQTLNCDIERKALCVREDTDKGKRGVNYHIFQLACDYYFHVLKCDKNQLKKTK